MEGLSGIQKNLEIQAQDEMASSGDINPDGCGMKRATFGAASAGVHANGVRFRAVFLRPNHGLGAGCWASSTPGEILTKDQVHDAGSLSRPRA